jgi:hypothetical protein
MTFWMSETLRLSLSRSRSRERKRNRRSPALCGALHVETVRHRRYIRPWGYYCPVLRRSFPRLAPLINGGAFRFPAPSVLYHRGHEPGRSARRFASSSRTGRSRFAGDRSASSLVRGRTAHVGRTPLIGRDCHAVGEQMAGRDVGSASRRPSTSWASPSSAARPELAVPASTKEPAGPHAGEAQDDQRGDVA